jgi:hypothetical protein
MLPVLHISKSRQKLSFIKSDGRVIICYENERVSVVSSFFQMYLRKYAHSSANMQDLIKILEQVNICFVSS